MPITLPGYDGEWERVPSNIVGKGCDLAQSRIPYHRARTERETLDAIGELVGAQIAYVGSVVYQQTSLPEWVKRERAKMATRQPPVWHTESFWEDYAYIHQRHFVHTSPNDSRLLAYTQSPEKGERDIQTPIKPGRYLKQYFGDVLSEKKIAFLASWQISGTRPEDASGQNSLLFATTPDEIADIYIRGPYSCMSGDHLGGIKTHPTRAYAYGDLAIAYLNKEDAKTGHVRPAARCLVWPAKKVAGRVYPTEGHWQRDGFQTQAESRAMFNLMTNLLKKDGYQFCGEGGSFDGARICKISHHTQPKHWAVPYMDNNLCLQKGDKDYFIIGPSHVRAGNTGGWLESSAFVFGHCSCCNKPVEEARDGKYAYAEWYGNRATDQYFYCNACAKVKTYLCEESGVHFVARRMPSVDLNGRTVAKGWRDANCFLSSFSGKWYVGRAAGRVLMSDGGSWTNQEFEENGFTCKITGEKLPISQRHPENPEIKAGLDIPAAQTQLAALTTWQKAALYNMLRNGGQNDGSRAKSVHDLKNMGLAENGLYGGRLSSQGKVVGYLMLKAGEEVKDDSEVTEDYTRITLPPTTISTNYIAFNIR